MPWTSMKQELTKMSYLADPHLSMNMILTYYHLCLSRLLELALGNKCA